MLGQKIGMTQVFDEQGKMAPVTVLKVGPCPVLLVRDQQRDGYDAVQLGFMDKSRKRSTRAERGHVSAEMESKRRKSGVALAPKANCEPQRYIREFRLEGPPADIKVGSILLAAEVFKKVKRKREGEEVEMFPPVDVIGTSKGRGTAGVMKRHGFAGLPASHGVKKHHRSPGSIGSLASNRGSGRPKRGRRMAGRYGNERVTIRNLTIVSIDSENHLILVKGAVPGPNGGMVMIQPTNKRKI